MTITSRIKHAWNAFAQDNVNIRFDRGPSTSRPAHRTHNAFSMASYTKTIFNRIAIDASMANFKHVKVNEENEDETLIKSGLHNCLTLEANIDQNYIQFLHDIVYSMFDEGVVAVVPVETNISPLETGGYDILSMRVGKIMQWYPQHVEIQLYDERTGQNERITMLKKDVAIIENPLYEVVNSDNSTLKRLMNKLTQMDNVDEIASSGRLDLLLSVPYSVKSDLQKAMAQERIKSIEEQLTIGRNGIAYIDATEKVTQLNRPANSQLKDTVIDLTQQLYNQLGLTENIFNGTAREHEIRNYYTRTIDPILDAVVAEFNRKFLTKTARTQGHRIKYFRDLMRFVPVETIANLGDALRRNRIATSNEIRKFIGLPHSSDPDADKLSNPNLTDEQQSGKEGPPKPTTVKPSYDAKLEEEIAKEEKMKAEESEEFK